MKRKNFIKSTTLTSLFLIVKPLSYFSKSNFELAKKDNMKEWTITNHQGNKYRNTIECNDIKSNIKIMHITDSHLSIFKNGKTEYPENAERMNMAYVNPTHYLSGQQHSKVEHFEEILKKAKSEKVDLLLVTGDILNNPSIYGVDYLKERLENSGIKYLYTAGNHDWHFEGMKGSIDSLRKKWINKRLLPLYNGENPLCYSKIINGINFVMIDDSTYQINKEQLDFFRKQTDMKYPIILSMHIPVYQPEDKNESLFGIGDPRWGYEYDQESYKTEKRERWSKDGNKKETLEFIIEVLSCKKVISIFSGHHHASMIRKISPSANQYLTQASYSGAHRIIEIIK